MEVRAARVGVSHTGRCESHGQMKKRRTMNEGKTNDERRNDEEMTKVRRRNDEGKAKVRRSYLNDTILGKR